MPDCEHHCPFLNRPDARCARHFHLDHLRHAFAYCFDAYHSCTVYAERLEERQERRGAALAEGDGHRHYAATPGTAYGTIPPDPRAGSARPQFVPLAVAGRYAQSASGGR